MGRKEGGIKSRDKLLKEDPEFYIKLGKLGGSVKNPKKGFGSLDKEKHREASSKGGTISRRKKPSV